ncbi:MAG: helix-turn-helix transcriptional regulator [Acidimicrobiia bacterium]|nr:helix-turn-helix transcriptional regulator [Acidimicrobiia bacterium]
MTATTSPSAAPTAPPPEFGARLRWWRTIRRYSQLDLANEAQVSSRHLSFLETGRSRPSREMVIHLATVLELPLRDGNGLLAAAGFAPAYSEIDLDASEMAGIRTVLTMILEAHLPNPAVVVNRLGDLVDANPAALRLMAAAVPAGSKALEPKPNLHRLVYHPDGIRDRTRNWVELASALLLRLERERNHRPADEALVALVEEMVSYPDVAELRSRPPVPVGSELLVPMVIELDDGGELSLLTTISTIGSPHDVTLDELRLETFFPADDAGRERLATWSAS